MNIKHYLTLFFYFCVLQTPSSVVLNAENFSPNVLCLVDKCENNYLFRGNLPLNEGVFCYDELKSHIQGYLQQYDAPINQDFQLICISFLNTLANKNDIDTENSWFASHPEKGWVWRYPLFGYICKPSSMPAFLRKLFYRTDPDGIRYLMEQIDHLMHEESDLPKVIYMHCKVGKDRTGEACASYLMQYKNYSYKQAVLFNKLVAKRTIRDLSMNGIRWHAYYLKEMCNFKQIGEVD